MKIEVIFILSACLISCSNRIDVREFKENGDTRIIEKTQSKEMEDVNKPKAIIKDGYTYSINSLSKGIDLKLKEIFEIERDILEYHFTITGMDENITSDFISNDINDEYLAIELDDSIIPGCIRIDFQWNGFTTSPYGYSGSKYYLLEENGKAKLVFYYFKEVGMQDSKYVTLKSIKKDERALELLYEYYYSLGSPDLGHGNIRLYYSINDGSVKFDKIVSEVYKSGQFVDGLYSTKDPKYKINPPQEMIITKDSLNDEFKNSIPKYLLIGF